MHRRLLAPALLSLSLLWSAAGCDGGGSEDAAITYYRDVKPILDARCIRCHVDGGIAPMPLGTYDEAYPFRARIREKVADRIMPPWEAGPGCNEYQADFSLTDAQIDTVTGWVDLGAPAGDPTTEPPALVVETPDLSRVDVTLAPPDPYTPQQSPDEYRCFVLPWEETATSFVTGMRATPGMRTEVHHVVVYMAAAADAAGYQALDDAEPGLGYTCFGGPGGGNASLLGVWAPGGTGRDYPEGTGLRVEPGAVVIMQVHYNTLDQEPVPDVTSLEFSIESSVPNEAYMSFWGNPLWTLGGMPIPAGDPDVMHSYSAAPSDLFGIPIPLRLWMVGLHMHTRGTRALLSVVHSASDECAIEIPNWDFHWQSLYVLDAPMTIFPGDEVYLECHWDNSAGNQPLVDGVPLPPEDLNWGEGTTDEMCLGIAYVSL